MEEKKLSATKRSLRSRPPLPSAAPWLFFSCEYGENQAFYNLLEPNKRNCIKKIPEIRRRLYWQSPSHEGWLVIFCNDPLGLDVDDDNDISNSISECGDCFLWNPSSLEKIKLPNLFNFIDYRNHMPSDCVLTSSPSNNNNKTSMVFFLFNTIRERDSLLVYCRPGDQQWRSEKLSPVDIDGHGFLSGSLVCFRDKLYIFFRFNWHFEIEIENKAEADTPMRSFSVSGYPHFSDARHVFFIASSDEIFMVHKCYKNRGDLVLQNLVIDIRLWRLNFSLMVWEELTSLGDNVVFLGKNTTACCSTSELGLTRGCVYYTVRGDRSLYKYDLEGQSISVSLSCLKLPNSFSLSEWMMMPPPLRACDGRTKIMLLTDKEEHNTKDEQEKKTNTSNDEKQVQGRSENGVELGEEKQSGVLNKEILELITNYLPPVDYLHLRAVSREHRSLLPAANWGTYFAEISMKITSLSPLLVFSEHNGCIYNFLDPMHNNEKYLMNGQKDLLGATIRFSRGGWLLMTKGKRNIFFYNPFTRARIDLPNLPHPFTIMSFSSSPTSSDCAVFCITEDFDEDYEENIFVAVITKGDNVWHSGTYPKRNFWACFNNPLFFNGAFYCVDYKGNLGIFKINGGVSQEVVASPQLHLNSSYPKFLVEHERELLLVDLGRLGTSIRVLRLDFSTNSWVRVESLGNHMMFISNTSCMFAVAPNSDMKNKIYLPRLHGEGILFYSLETDTCHSIGSQSSVNGFYDTREQLNCSWIEPNCLRKTTVEELDWFNI